MKQTTSSTIKNEEPFDFVKLDWNDKPGTNNEAYTIVRYKGISFCLTKNNMNLIIDFIKRFDHD